MVEATIVMFDVLCVLKFWFDDVSLSPKEVEECNRWRSENRGVKARRTREILEAAEALEQDTMHPSRGSRREARFRFPERFRN